MGSATHTVSPGSKEVCALGPVSLTRAGHVWVQGCSLCTSSQASCRLCGHYTGESEPHLMRASFLSPVEQNESKSAQRI